MNSYRIQIRSEGKYYDGIVDAETDSEALSQAEKKMRAGEFQCQDEDFYNKSRVFITYEELKNGTTNANIGEASVGVQMGEPSVTTRQSND